MWRVARKLHERLTFPASVFSPSDHREKRGMSYFLSMAVNPSPQTLSRKLSDGREHRWRGDRERQIIDERVAVLMAERGGRQKER